MAAPAPPGQHTPLRGDVPEGADVSDPNSLQTRLAVPVLGVNDVAWATRAEVKLEAEEEELKAEEEELSAEKEKVEAEEEELMQEWRTFMAEMSVTNDFSLRRLMQSPEVEQWKKDHFVELQKRRDHVDERLASASSAYAAVATMRAQASLKRGRESTGATPGAKRVRASSPRTPAPAGVLQLHQTPEEHSSQALRAQARAVYKMLEVGDFTFDHDFDNEDDYIHEPLIELRQRCAQTLENGVSEYISRFAHDLIPVRRRSMVKFCFAAEYTSARGAQCVHESVPDMVVFRRTDELPIKELRTEKLLASTCRQHKPLLIEVQSGSRTLEESKVRLVTTLFSFVKHTGADVDAESVYGIVVEESLERIHVVRFKSGKYETDGSFPARCLVDICRKVLCGSAEEDTQHTPHPSVFQQRATIPKHTHTRAPPICPQHHVLAP